MFLDRLSDLVSKKVNDNFTAAIEAINNKISEIHVKIDILKQQNLRFKNLLDKHEQYSRRNNLRLHGIPENEQEKGTDEMVVNFFKDKLKMEVPVSALDRSHPSGRGNTGKPRSILIKFIDYHMRNNILRNRYLLKNTNFSINRRSNIY